MKSSALVAALSLMIAAPLIAAPDLQPDLAKGKAKVEEICITCHTIDGNSVAPLYPILAGQHIQYIEKQLKDYKAGKRVNNTMGPWAMTLTDQDRINVSAYFASQTLKERTAGDQKLADDGEKIYRGGIMAKNVPACMACHGPNGAGMPSQYPQLASQHAAYTEAQLQAFKEGARSNDKDNVMQEIAVKLTNAEIKAVAEYISGLQ
jgi:cytochrome c553